jgi:hypothetical protein
MLPSSDLFMVDSLQLFTVLKHTVPFLIFHLDECHSAECFSDECHSCESHSATYYSAMCQSDSIILLSVILMVNIILSIINLIVIMLSVIVCWVSFYLMSWHQLRVAFFQVISCLHISGNIFKS